MPLWLDLGGIHVVHACRHEASMRVVGDALGSNRFSTLHRFVRASDKADPLYDAVEVLLKGPEIDIAGHGLPPYFDKDGHARSKARVAWWREGATTLRELAVMDGNFTTTSGEPYPPLPDAEVGPAERSFSYGGDVPVFYGHYWRSGRPTEGLDYTAQTACVDFSAVDGKPGRLSMERRDRDPAGALRQRRRLEVAPRLPAARLRFQCVIMLCWNRSRLTSNGRRNMSEWLRPRGTYTAANRPACRRGRGTTAA